MSIPGSCLCGGVSFEVEPPFIRANHCHCSRCRKHSGAYGGVQTRVLPHQLRVLTGEELIRVWKPDDGGAVKAFCSRCGSSLFGGHWPDGEVVSIRLGAFDEDPGIRPEYRSYVGSTPAWLPVPDDGLPQYEAGPPP